jgi:hypothetical protein
MADPFRGLDGCGKSLLRHRRCRITVTRPRGLGHRSSDCRKKMLDYFATSRVTVLDVPIKEFDMLSDADISH